MIILVGTKQLGANIPGFLYFNKQLKFDFYEASSFFIAKEKSVIVPNLGKDKERKI